MIDFRPHHARMRDDWIRWCIAWILGSASTFSLLLALVHESYVVYLAVAGIWLTILPVFVLAFVLLTVRPIVAHEGGIEVDGELIAWRNCSAPKPALLSPGRAWVTIWTRSGFRDILIVGHVDAIARLRARADTFGGHSEPRLRSPRFRSACTKISTSDSSSDPSSGRPDDRVTISFPRSDTR